jgi:hypothetical protein
MHIIYTQTTLHDLWGQKGKAGLNLQCWMEVIKDLSCNSKNRVNVHCGGGAEGGDGGKTCKQT